MGGGGGGPLSRGEQHRVGSKTSRRRACMRHSRPQRARQQIRPGQSCAIKAMRPRRALGHGRLATHPLAPFRVAQTAAAVLGTSAAAAVAATCKMGAPLALAAGVIAAGK
jgi:hypothetical protein